MSPSKNCFKLSREWASWSKSGCGSDQQLAVITNDEDNDFIKNLIGTNNAWIGLSGSKTRYGRRNKEWKWVNGASLGTNKWASGQPDNHRPSWNSEDENCVMMYGSTDTNHGLWNDMGCSKREYYVCQLII